MTQPIISFHDENRWLSNFAGKVILQDNKLFTVEQLFQAAKTFLPEEKQQILDAPTPVIAKKLGKKVTLRGDWDHIKLAVMFELLQKKFSNWEFRNLLINTGDAILIEGNNWHDNFWGDCSCSSCKDKFGKNWLGRLLMLVRSQIWR